MVLAFIGFCLACKNEKKGYALFRNEILVVIE